MWFFSKSESNFIESGSWIEICGNSKTGMYLPLCYDGKCIKMYEKHKTIKCTYFIYFVTVRNLPRLKINTYNFFYRHLKFKCWRDWVFKQKISIFSYFVVTLKIWSASNHFLLRILLLKFIICLLSMNKMKFKIFFRFITRARDLMLKKPLKYA